MITIPMAEARRRLPELVRKVAEGHPPVAIGRRGRPQAMLVPAQGAKSPTERRSLRGLIEVEGSWEEVERGGEEIRGRLRASLARTARLIAGRAQRPKR